VKDKRVAVTEGITYFDHAKNPSYPSHWHVREDGWMGASLCRHEVIIIKKDKLIAGALSSTRAQRRGRFRDCQSHCPDF
jgi:hypothetical protein